MPGLPLTRKALMRKHNGRCHYCGVQCHSRDPLRAGYGTVDHVVPKSKGGTGLMENLVLACRGCNQRKAAMGAEEFQKQMKGSR